MLRASNIPARYVRGTIKIDDSTPLDKDGRGPRWVGAKTYKSAAQILANGGFSTSYSTTYVSVTHVWAEACVPYAHYRGAKLDNAGHRWIPLDPSFKDKKYQDGIAINVDFDYTAYLAKRTTFLPPEAYEQQVEAYIKGIAPNYGNNTLADVPYKGPVTPRRIDIIPVTLPYEVSSFTAWNSTITTSDTAEIPDDHRYKFTVAAKNSNNTILVQATIPMPGNMLSRTTLSYKGTTTADQSALDSWRADGSLNSAIPCTINVVPVIKVEGIEWAAGTTSVGLCTTNNRLDLKVIRGATTVNTVSYSNIGAANYHALQAYGFQISNRLLTERASRLLNSVKNTSNPNSNIEETEGEFLHVVGLKYMRYISDSYKRVAEMDGGSGESGNHLGLTCARMKVQYVFDLPFAVNRDGFLIDVPGAISRTADLNTGLVNWKTFMLGGYAASAYESYIWQENSHLDAVSTVRGIQFARETGIEVLSLNTSNWSIAGDETACANSSSQCYKFTHNADTSLNYAAAQVTSIYNNYIKSGYSLTIPRSLILYSGWKGQVFEANNGTNSATYAIAQAAGGYTVSTPISYTYASTTNTGLYQPPTLPSSIVSNDQPAATVGGGAISNGVTQYITLGGDPVNMVTGNMYHTERDISIKGRGGLPIVFERSYNSRNTQDGPLGFGWTHSFNHFLKFYGVEGGVAKVSWTDGTGSEKFFTATPDGSSGVPVNTTFVNPTGIFVIFKREADGTYTIREKNGLSYTFENMAGTVDQKAKLLSIKDRNENLITLSYNGSKLTSVVDLAGLSLIFSYTNNRITGVNDWTMRTHNYGYDGSGNLTTYKNPLAVAGKQNPVTYEYYTAVDGQYLNHSMKKYTLPKGNGMTFEYYMNGRVFRHYNTLGETNTFTYNDFRRETVQVNERGFTRRFFFDKYGNPEKIVEENGGERKYAYDAANPYNRLSKRDPMGYETKYEYDANGNVTKITNPSNSTVEFSYFNTFNQPGKVKDANGNYTLFQYDSKGNLLQQIKLKSGVGSGVDPTTYSPISSDIAAWSISTYDSIGNLLTSKRARDFTTQTGPTIEYTYDPIQNLNVMFVKRKGDKNGDGVIASDESDSAGFAYDGYNRLKDGIDADWHPTQFEYDDVDRVVRGSDALGNLRDYAYDNNGNPVGDKLKLPMGVLTLLDSSSATYDQSDRKASVTDAGGSITAYQYDSVGNVVKITNPDNYTLAFEYDENNHVVKAYDQENNAVTRTLDLDGKPRSITDPNGNMVKYEYYASERDGRLKKTIDAVGRITTFDYDSNGNAVSVTDNLGRTTLTSYDELNRPVRIVVPQYTDATYGVIRPVTKYSYDKLGNLVQVDAGRTDSSGTSPASDVLAVQMASLYDDFGRKIRETDALGKAWSFEYDVNNNIKTATDAKSQTTTYRWGYGHQLSSSTPSTGSGQALTYTRNPLGQVVKSQSPDVTYTYTYDLSHRLQSVNDSRGSKTTAYGYSPGGMLNYMSDSDGRRTDYLYDAVGRLAGILAPDYQYVAFNYDKGGRLTDKWLPNGASTRYTYNADNTLSQVQNRTSYTISLHDYTYDGVGNRQTHTEQVGTTTTPYKYLYDELNRLTEVRNSSTSALIEGYSYDVLNNRTSKTDGVNPVYYIYDSANQLKEVRQGSSTGAILANMVYDDNGNMTTRSEGATTTSMTYDALNRLSQISKTGQSDQSYVYDDQGRRIAKTVGSSTTNYLYNGPDITAEYTDWTTANAVYTHGPNMDDPIIRQAGSLKQYYHQDGLGSVVVLSDQSGSIGAPVNVALAANGGVITASSRNYENANQPSNVNNGDRKGANYSYWQDDTYNAYPDRLQIDFSGTKTISEIDVNTAQTSEYSQLEPTQSLTFTSRGITAFDVQYWDAAASAWVTIPGGSVTGNNLVWRKFTFSAIDTTKIRVVVNAALGGYSRVVELEAYTPAGINVALASNGGVATVSTAATYFSSSASAYESANLPTHVNNGDRKGANNAYWQDGTYNAYPDWVQIDFSGTKTISEIDVITRQDSSSPIEPTEATTFATYGITAFDVQYWDSVTSSWITVPGGSVTGNNLVWRKFTFSPIDTTKIRVLVSAAMYSYSRIVELEAYTPTGMNVALAANGGVATVSSTASLTNYQPGYMNNGDRAGFASHYWQDNSNNVYPDWVEVAFAREMEINEVNLFSVQDNQSSPQEPTETMTFNNYGVSAYDLQYWNNATSNWTTITSITNSNKVWSKVTFSTVKTSKIRIQVNNAKGGYSRIAEIEAYAPAGGGTQRFDAWGNKIGGNGTIPQYGYTGREPDETGLIYYRARYYDPTIGRFTQRDPVGLRGGVNQYGYVGGNPVNFTDPMGLLANNSNTNAVTQSTSYYGSSVDQGGGGVSGMSAGSQSLSSTANREIGPVPGYPETGKYSWRKENDEIFIQAVDNYNKSYDLSPGDTGYATPERLKAQAMIESGGSKKAFFTDPLQVNNAGDWVNKKTEVAGIEKGQTMTPSTSSSAALEWLRYKGYNHDNKGNETTYKGDYGALRDYNGNKKTYPTHPGVEHRDWYATQILRKESEMNK